jgi:hypothetical protein
LSKSAKDSADLETVTQRETDLAWRLYVLASEGRIDGDHRENVRAILDVAPRAGQPVEHLEIDGLRTLRQIGRASPLVQLLQKAVAMSPSLRMTLMRLEQRTRTGPQATKIRQLLRFVDGEVDPHAVESAIVRSALKIEERAQRFKEARTRHASRPH